MIKKVLYKTRNTEFDAVALRIVDAYNVSGVTTDVWLRDMVSTIKVKHSEMNAAIKRQKAESQLEEYDSVLDFNTRSFFNLVDGYTWHPQKTVSDSAAAINKVLAKYGLNMIQESYATQSSLTLSLLTDLATAESVKNLKVLSGCTELVTGITKAHDAFRQYYISYKQQKDTDNQGDSATELRKELALLINDKLVGYLNAMVNVNEKVYGKLVSTIAQIVDDNNDAVKRRKTADSQQ